MGNLSGKRSSERLRVAVARKDRAHYAQAGRAGDDSDNVVELKIHLGQRLCRPHTAADARVDARRCAA
jgi:hypothetical protein